MSPEQLLALDDVDKRSDVYALGVTLFECLTGRMPYEGTYQTVLLQVCSTDPVPGIEALEPSTPAALVEVVKRAMSKERGERFPTMREFKRALRGALSSPREQTYFFGPPRTEESSLQVSEQSQRRKLVRASYVTPVRLIVGDITIDARTEDISTGGLLVICRQICPTDQPATLRFALPIEGTVVGIAVQVRWVRAARADDPEGPRAIGVEFIDAPADMTASIARYVSYMTSPDAK
jgi:serine/threonine protein kinase